MLESEGWVVSVGETEGHPLIVAWDPRWPADYMDQGRRWAMEVVVVLARVTEHGLPVEGDYGWLAEVEGRLVTKLASAPEEDRLDWRFVARTYGEGVVRFCFYAPRPSRAAERVKDALECLAEARVTVTEDPRWEAWARLRQEVEGELGGVPPSLRDDPATADPSPRLAHRRPREDQPWPGEETQCHPDE